MRPNHVAFCPCLRIGELGLSDDRVFGVCIAVKELHAANANASTLATGELPRDNIERVDMKKVNGEDQMKKTNVHLSSFL
jgi:hypothetical protein